MLKNIINIMNSIRTSVMQLKSNAIEMDMASNIYFYTLNFV